MRRKPMQIEKDTVQPATPDSLVKRNELIAALDKDEFKSLFYLLAGKPDSTIKFFDDPVVVAPNDIVQLHQDMVDKLSTHHIQAVIASVSVTFTDNTVKEFGTWAEFESHKWTRAEVTDSVMAKWDFLVKMQQYEIAQRHTVTLRISSRVKQSHILQAVASKYGDKIEEIDIEASPVYCRVDFINQVLGQELIQLVADWYNARPKAKEEPPVWTHMKRKKFQYAQAIHYSIPAFTALLLVAGLFLFCAQHDLSQPASLATLRCLFAWLFVGSLSVFFIADVSGRIASTAYGALRDFGKKHAFLFTNGDQNEKQRIEQRNRTLIRRYLKRAIGAFLYDVAVAIVTAKLIR